MDSIATAPRHARQSTAASARVGLRRAGGFKETAPLRVAMSFMAGAKLASRVDWVPQALQDGVAARVRICVRTLKSPIAEAICVTGTARAWACDHVTVVCGDIVRQPGPGKKTGLA